MSNKTHYKKLRNPLYMGSYELMTGGEPKDMVVTILKVDKQMVNNGGKSEECVVATLKNQKPFILNSTNSKMITKVTGSPYIEDWSGKSIILYVTKVKFGRDWHDALRIRDEVPREDIKEDLNPQHERWDGALKAIREGKVTVESIQQAFNINDENLKLLQNERKA